MSTPNHALRVAIVVQSMDWKTSAEIHEGLRIAGEDVSLNWTRVVVGQMVRAGRLEFRCKVLPANTGRRVRKRKNGRHTWEYRAIPAKERIEAA